MSKVKSLGMRLAFRKEGGFVNCYVAQEETMQDATHIGSMRVTALEADGVWDDWKDLMRRVLSHHIKESIGVTPVWGGEQKAPESERAGEA